jgi:hypothetical protein
MNHGSVQEVQVELAVRTGGSIVTLHGHLNSAAMFYMVFFHFSLQ